MAAHGGAGTPPYAAWTIMPTLWIVLAATVAAQPPGRLPEEPTGGTPTRMCSEAMRSDARLADVTFVDPLRGWAVGDRGTIWHTDDGGRRWHLQESGVSCPLKSVSFVDAETGWAAGGFARPYTHDGTGVLLSTRDGGRHWTPIPKLLLPALQRVRFFSRRHGWAVGNPSAMFPNGAFITDDGGRTWNPLSGARITTWQSADFLDRTTGVLAGFDGTAATIRRGGVQPARTARFGLRRLAEVELVPEIQPQVYGWLVGQGGLVMITPDLGSTWQIPPAELPEGMISEFDFATIEVRGPKAWIAGSPGSQILHTADAGRSWTVFSTRQTLPIESLCFVDDQHGWAVGQLGTILATADGGQSWTRQRAGGGRAGLLALLAEPDDVPLELLAQLSGDEGYLTAVELIARRDLEVAPGGGVPADHRIHEAVVSTGASSARTAWRFPLRQPGLDLDADRVIEGWNRVNDGRASQELEAHLVRQIRLWRPEVLLTHGAASRGAGSAGPLIHQATLKAVERSADPTWYPQQITCAGLEPWKVKRVFASLGPGTRGSTTVTTSRLSARLGSTLADAAGEGRSLVQSRFCPAPDSFGFQLVSDEQGSTSGGDDFFAGISLSPGSDARRVLANPAPGARDLVRRIAQRRRNTQAILEHSQGSAQQGIGLLAQVGELTRDVDPLSAGEILYHLGQGYYQGGNWPLAAETFLRLAERHPDHPLSDAALAWLVQYYGSGEAAWRVAASNRVTVQQASAPAIDPRLSEDRPERAAAIAKQIETTRPDLFAKPEIGFPLAVVARQRGFTKDAERFYLARRRSATQDAWSACALGEKWLAAPQGPGPKPVLRCVAAPSKPHLDGTLDDEVWQQAKAAELSSSQHDDAGWPAAVMLAYDAEFLYLAVHCRRAPGARYSTSDEARPRDADLSGCDRVDLLVDLDRDFATYYRLTVDHRGWPQDACWGDFTWDPTWFVAAAGDETSWTAEIAVPLDQLTGAYPTPGTAWAIGIQRTVPRVGFQSWTTPATTQIAPEGFGYLRFE